MYGSKEVQKLMLKDKLVYQNTLPVGTVLLEGKAELNSGTSFLKLPLISGNWSNVNSNVKISASLDMFRNWTISLNELKNGKNINVGGNPKYITFKAVDGGIEIKYDFNGSYITRIELV